MTFETPDQYELRTMPDAFTKAKGDRTKPGKPAWAAKNDGIQALVDKMGIEAYRKQVEWDRKHMAGQDL